MTNMMPLITQSCHFKAGLHCIRKLTAAMELDQVGNLQYTSLQPTLTSHQLLHAIQQISLASLQKTNI